MSPGPGSVFPATLKTWLNDLVASIPSRGSGTLLELLLGTMLTPRGMISQALLAIPPRRGWQAYYWFVEHARFPWISLVRALCAIVQREFPEARRSLIIDDTLLFRSSKKAPDAALRFDHVKRANRLRVVLCQQIVTLSASIVDETGRFRAVPLLSLMVKADGHPGRLSLANALLGAVARQFPAVGVVMDLWFIKGPLVLWAAQRGITVIGRVRHDSALFRFPAPAAPGKRGPPKKYGSQITREDWNALPAREAVLAAYGGVRARWCGITCRPRILRGVPARIVRVSMYDTVKHNWSPNRLLLSTDTALSDEAILINSSRRSATEPLFRDLKDTEGFQELWMQTRKPLLRWLHIVQTGAALVIMQSARADPQLNALAHIGGWRKEKRPSTPGLVKAALLGAFRYHAPLPLLGADRQPARKS
ncbi:IS701 family transposase [Azospirillum canadense]|uniref:IS701 family transposase n=1 Tax=Azospirillum canadense TaxID=403962 RepID=UPI002225E4BB|nr:transposase [Azospirillum canadense]MCW2241347.1 hypothetical protein [Azospirillum canadense]